MRNSLRRFAILALDPGGRVAGVALWLDGLQACGDIVDLDLAKCNTLATLDELMLADTELPLMIVSEYPTAGTPNGPQVRQAANIVIARIKKTYPRRVKVVKVVPQSWQSRVTKGMPGNGPKDRSVARASVDYPYGAEMLKAHTDMADALNILTYARGFLTWQDGK